MTQSRTSSPALLAVDRDLKIRTWSQSAEEMFGWTPAEALGQSAFDLLGCSFDQTGHWPIQDWQPCTFLSTKRHKNGSTFSLRVSFEPLHAGALADHGVMLLDREVVQAGEVEARYQSVVAAMQEGVVVQAADSTILSCNEAAERILGLTHDQLLGRTSLDPRWRAVHEDGSPFPGQSHPGVVTLRTGREMSGVVMGVHKTDGSVTWISINTTVIRSAAIEAPRTVVATFSDITRQKLAEEALRAQREQLQFVLQGANEGFWDWHVPSGRATFSERWVRMLGYEPGEIAGDYASWADLVHPDELPAVREVLDRHLRGELAFYDAEFRMRGKDGRWVWVLARGQVVERDADGRPLRATGTHSDTTARREAEEQLREALRRNEALVRELRAALDNVKVLSGLLPLCAWCKSVRNDAGYWEQIETYLSERTEARFTHGLCPSCSNQMLPGG